MHRITNCKGRIVAAVLLVGLLSLWVGTAKLSARGRNSLRAGGLAAQRAASIVRDDAAARAAFLAAAPVFTHPRCQNCHPAGEAPLQGDDSHPHAQSVKRGLHGKGKYGMKCDACHQLANLPGVHMPPGAPNWHLPPPQMRMVFVGKTPGELCSQLKDPSRNGGKTINQIIEHVTSDKLVGWGWNPGEGRATPPLSR
ncbi:MAG TPA: hypothetical protein VGL91_12490, partial [Acidobacteriota bacterium]